MGVLTQKTKNMDDDFMISFVQGILTESSLFGVNHTFPSTSDNGFLVHSFYSLIYFS